MVRTRLDGIGTCPGGEMISPSMFADRAAQKVRSWRSNRRQCSLSSDCPSRLECDVSCGKPDNHDLEGDWSGPKSELQPIKSATPSLCCNPSLAFEQRYNNKVLKPSVCPLHSRSEVSLRPNFRRSSHRCVHRRVSSRPAEQSINKDML